MFWLTINGYSGSVSQSDYRNFRGVIGRCERCGKSVSSAVFSSLRNVFSTIQKLLHFFSLQNADEKLSTPMFDFALILLQESHRDVEWSCDLVRFVDHVILLICCRFVASLADLLDNGTFASGSGVSISGRKCWK